MTWNTNGKEFKKILVVDDEESIRVMLKGILSKEGYIVKVAKDGKEALEKIEAWQPQIVLADIRMHEIDGITLTKVIREKFPETIIILMTAYGSNETAIEAIRVGAYDYIPKPFTKEELILCLLKVEERERLKRENFELRMRLKEVEEYEGIVARSEVMKKIFSTIEKVADYRTTVLIQGESGTGKELVARAIHKRSRWRENPFIAINCGAIPEHLLESELFGYKKGAFTDAYTDKRGLFEEANEGTLFLDEIGEMPTSLQVKLLRVLQDNTIRRLGDTKDIVVNLRVIAANAADLNEQVKAGKFRQDLFYRLNVLTIKIPPLRERTEDIEPLIEYFIYKNNLKLKKSIKGVAGEAKKILLNYTWPGNVRELENVIERSMVLAEKDIIEVEDLPEYLSHGDNAVKMYLSSGDFSIKKAMRSLEEELIRKALKKTGGNKSAAARLLEISHRALLYKIKEYNIE